jgi:hypothetical protein
MMAMMMLTTLMTAGTQGAGPGSSLDFQNLHVAALLRREKRIQHLATLRLGVVVQQPSAPHAQRQ